MRASHSIGVSYVKRSPHCQRGIDSDLSEEASPEALRADCRHGHREDSSVPEIKANMRSSPGIITQRGCTYAGCKGVVIGPSRDILSLVHGPIGCSFYAWLTRRNQTRRQRQDDSEFHELLPVDRHAGRKHRLRRREEAEGSGARGVSSSFIRKRLRSSQPARSDSSETTCMPWPVK